jgi:hypothetical protein
MVVPLQVEDVAWGDCLCSAKGCVKPADCLYESEPYCFDCAEALIERQIAVDINPSLRATLPAFDD